MTLSFCQYWVVSEWWHYGIIRLFVGMGNVGFFQAGFCLSLEIVGPKARGVCGQIFQIAYSLGYMSMSLFAFFFRDWRSLSLVFSLGHIPALIFLLFFIDESPSFLIRHGKIKHAKKVLRKMAIVNKKPKVVDKIEEMKFEISKSKSESLLALFTNGRYLVISILINMLTWFAVNIGYFGLSLNVSNLDGDVYIINMVYAIIEIPAYFFSVWLMESPTFGRRKGLSFSFFLGAAGIITSTVISEITFCDEI